jgi:heat-inducible transcriptional repressor
MRAALTDKHEKILGAVVRSYVSSGKPVGSRYVCRRFRLAMSPASIRNRMGELEGMGLIMKPHTSAGRIPTERGYRLYVDRVMKSWLLKRSETVAIRRVMNPSLSVDEVLERISRLLESLSHQICVALLPETDDATVSRLETVRISRRRLLVALTIEPGRQRTVTLELDSPGALEASSRLIRMTAGLILGKTLREASEAVQNLRLCTERFGCSVDDLRTALSRLLSEGHQGVHVSGTANAITMIDREEAKSLLEVLESRQRIAEMLLADRDEPGATVSIGSENRYKQMKQCSVVRSPYWIGDARGVVALIGSLRMQYPRLVALVDYTSRELTRFLANEGGRLKGGHKGRTGPRA